MASSSSHSHQNPQNLNDQMAAPLSENTQNSDRSIPPGFYFNPKPADLVMYHIMAAAGDDLPFLHKEDVCSLHPGLLWAIRRQNNDVQRVHVTLSPVSGGRKIGGADFVWKPSGRPVPIYVEEMVEPLGFCQRHVLEASGTPDYWVLRQYQASDIENDLSGYAVCEVCWESPLFKDAQNEVAKARLALVNASQLLVDADSSSQLATTLLRSSAASPSSGSGGRIRLRNRAVKRKVTKNKAVVRPPVASAAILKERRGAAAKRILDQVEDTLPDLSSYHENSDVTLVNIEAENGEGANGVLQNGKGLNGEGANGDLQNEEGKVLNGEVQGLMNGEVANGEGLNDLQNGEVANGEGLKELQNGEGANGEELKVLNGDVQNGEVQGLMNGEVANGEGLNDLQNGEVANGEGLKELQNGEGANGEELKVLNGDVQNGEVQGLMNGEVANGEGLKELQNGEGANGEELNGKENVEEKTFTEELWEGIASFWKGW